MTTPPPILFSRVWSMPNHDTFSTPPIRDFVNRYLGPSKVSVDPFARNKQLATYTNDLNPSTIAQSHLECLAFVEILISQGVKADLLLFDPPYSPRQTKECYDSIGIKMQQDDALLGKICGRWKAAFNELLTDDATILSFGWNTVGMGKKFGFAPVEIMLVCHGSVHNDTICMAERRMQTPIPTNPRQTL